jgi:hypothetical protein
MCTQSGDVFKVLMNNININGELGNRSPGDCSPSSTQNGRALRVHHTILGKARPICLARNAPMSMGRFLCDSYVSNDPHCHSYTHILNGRMPYSHERHERMSPGSAASPLCPTSASHISTYPNAQQRSTRDQRSAPCILLTPFEFLLIFSLEHLSSSTPLHRPPGMRPESLLLRSCEPDFHLSPK